MASYSHELVIKKRKIFPLPDELILQFLSEYFYDIPDIVNMARVIISVKDVLRENIDYIIHKIIMNNKKTRPSIAYLINSVYNKDQSDKKYVQIIQLNNFLVKNSYEMINKNLKDVSEKFLDNDTRIKRENISVYHVMRVKLLLNHKFASESCDLNIEQFNMFVKLFYINGYNINDAYYIAKYLDENKIQIMNLLISRGINIIDAKKVANSITFNKIDLYLHLIDNNFLSDLAITVITELNETQHILMWDIINKGVLPKYAPLIVENNLSEEHIDLFLILQSMNIGDDLLFELISDERIEITEYSLILIELGISHQLALYLARDVFDNFDRDRLDLYIKLYKLGIPNDIFEYIADDGLDYLTDDRVSKILELLKQNINPSTAYELVSNNYTAEQIDYLLSLINEGYGCSTALKIVDGELNDQMIDRIKFFRIFAPEINTDDIEYIIRDGNEDILMQLLVIDFDISYYISFLHSFFYLHMPIEHIRNYIQIIHQLKSHNVSFDDINDFIRKYKLELNIYHNRNIWTGELIESLVYLIINGMSIDMAIYIGFKLGLEYTTLIINKGSEFIKNLLSYNKYQMNIFLNLVKENNSIEKSREYVLNETKDKMYKIIDIISCGLSFEFAFKLYNKDYSFN